VSPRRPFIDVRRPTGDRRQGNRDADAALDPEINLVMVTGYPIFRRSDQQGSRPADKIFYIAKPFKSPR